MEARVGRTNQREYCSSCRKASMGVHANPKKRLLPPKWNGMLTTHCVTGYGSRGERLVAGVVPLSADKSKVLMIQSAGPGGWVLPKGGWETDEATASIAACREAWEEAGVVCVVQRDLGLIPDMRPAASLTSSSPKASYQFFEVTVEREEAEWPEKHKRQRKWVTFAQAATALANRPELLEALKRSSLQR